MKKVSVFFAALLLIIGLCSCSSQQMTEEEKLAEFLEMIELSSLEIVRYIVDAEWDNYGEFLTDMDIPNSWQIIDELISQGHPEEVDHLRDLIEEIGCYPSALFGEYVADSQCVIHKTNGSCFESIPSDELIAIAHSGDLSGYLDEYKLCEECC